MPNSEGRQIYPTGCFGMSDSETCWRKQKGRYGNMRWALNMLRNFWFQNSWSVTRCLKNYFYRASNRECCFYIPEVSTTKIISLIITKLCIYLWTVTGPWHCLPVPIFVLIWAFLFQIFIIGTLIISLLPKEILLIWDFIFKKYLECSLSVLRKL